MVASQASTSFPLPPARGGPTALSGDYDLSANVLTINFSEAVQAAVLSAGQFTIVGNVAGSASSSGVTPVTSTSSLSIPCTPSGLSGITGTVTYHGSPSNQLVSTATGLPLLPFTGLVVPMAS